MFIFYGSMDCDVGWALDSIDYNITRNKQTQIMPAPVVINIWIVDISIQMSFKNSFALNTKSDNGMDNEKNKDKLPMSWKLQFFGIYIYKYIFH